MGCLLTPPCFPAPSSEQSARIGYAAKEHSILSPRVCPPTASAPEGLSNVGAMDFQTCTSTMVEANVSSKHARKHEAHPPRVKTKKKRSIIDSVWFYLCWRKQCGQLWKKNACYSKLSCLLQTYCIQVEHQPTKKRQWWLSVELRHWARAVSLSYGVTSYGSALEDGCCKLMVGIYCMLYNLWCCARVCDRRQDTSASQVLK